MLTHDILPAVLDAMRDEGVPPSDPSLVADGELHRYHVEGDKARTLNGWYLVHLDGTPAAAFGSWKTGAWSTWSAKGRESMTPGERRELRERIEAAKRKREAERKAKHAQAADRSERIVKAARPANPAHHYLTRKRIKRHHALQRGNELVLPVQDFDGRIWSVQFIDRGGRKLLLAGGRKRGNFIHVDGPEDFSRVLICEGWATGATLAEIEPDALVLAAIDAGNLEPVAVEARRRWPRESIVICADADAVGVEKAEAAALAAGALVAVPEFPPGVEGSDFNDLAGGVAA